MHGGEPSHEMDRMGSHVPLNGNAREQLPPFFARFAYPKPQPSLPMGILVKRVWIVAMAWQLLPLYLSLFIFGMPHGGADHLLLWVW